MQQRIIVFAQLETCLRWAGYCLDLSGAKVLFVMPNAVVFEYNGQVIMAVSRDEE